MAKEKKIACFRLSSRVIFSDDAAGKFFSKKVN